MNLALLLSTTPTAAHDEVIDRLRRRVTAYSEDEARDKDGKWTKGGKSLKTVKPDEAKADAHLRNLVKNIVLYHGTADDAVAQILKEGIVPGKSAGGDEWAKENMGIDMAQGRTVSAFATTEKENALRYASIAAETRHAVPVVIKMEVPEDVFKTSFQIDEQQLSGGAFRTEKSLPASWITGIAKGKFNDNFDPDYVGYMMAPIRHVTVGRFAKPKVSATGMKTVYFVIMVDGVKAVHAYSEDEARDAHGRWTESATQLDLPIAKDIKKFHVAAITQAVTDVAKRLGFPMSRVAIETEKEDKVNIDGQTGSASGVYDSRAQTITIYPKQISDAEEAKAVIAHEIQHHVFNKVMGKVRDILHDVDSPQAVANIAQPYGKIITLMNDPLRLFKEDGVTPYSRMYWEDAMKSSTPPLSAVNETMGEIAYLDERHHGPVTKDVNNDLKSEVGQTWRGLYNSFQEAYAKLPKTRARAKKIAAAVTQGIVDGKIALIAPYSPHLLRVLYSDGSSAFVTRTPDMQAYSELEPRDKDGKWTTGGDSEIFVSPNLTENLAIKDAIRFLTSDRQSRFEAKARDVVAEVAGGGKVEGAIGVWADGAENSTAITLPHAEADVLRYTASLLGKSGEQKAVLAWQNAANGPHALYTLSTGLEPTQIAADSLKLGIAFQTIVPGEHGGRIQILDEDGSLAGKVEALGSLPGYKPVGVQRGTGEFIGSWTSREEGNVAYDKIIQDYEKAHQGYKGSLQFSSTDGDKGWSDLYRRIEAAKINTICRCGHTLAQHPSPDYGCKFCGEEQCPGFLQLRAYSPDEARDKNGEWTDGGQRDRAADAKRTYNPATLEKQRIADEAEMRLSKAIGLPRTKNNSAFDLVGKGVAVEVKTLVDRKRDEITMHPESLQRKQKEARKTKVNAYTVVLDERPGKQQVYWKVGVGSFVLSTMNRATSVQALRKVLVPR